MLVAQHACSKRVDPDDLETGGGLDFCVFGEGPGEVLELVPVKDQVADAGKVSAGDDVGEDLWRGALRGIEFVHAVEDGKRFEIDLLTGERELAGETEAVTCFGERAVAEVAGTTEAEGCQPYSPWRFCVCSVCDEALVQGLLT